MKAILLIAVVAANEFGRTRKDARFNMGFSSQGQRSRATFSGFAVTVDVQDRLLHETLASPIMQELMRNLTDLMLAVAVGIPADPQFQKHAKLVAKQTEFVAANIEALTVNPHLRMHAERIAGQISTLLADPKLKEQAEHIADHLENIIMNRFQQRGKRVNEHTAVMLPHVKSLGQNKKQLKRVHDATVLAATRKCDVHESRGSGIDRLLEHMVYTRLDLSEGAAKLQFQDLDNTALGMKATPGMPRGPITHKGALSWRSLIFASHLAAKWGERMWEFAAGLLLLQIAGGDSLRFPAALQLAMLLTNALVGPKVGALIGHGHPLRTPLAALAVQNGGIALAALSAVLALVLFEHESVSRAAAIACIMICSCFASLGSMGRTISVEQYWTRALSAGDDMALARLSSQMRRIDLLCKVLAPVAAGGVMSFFSPALAGSLVAAANVAAWPVEALCLIAVIREPFCRDCLLTGVVHGAKGSHDVERGHQIRFGALAASSASRFRGLAARGKAWQLYFAQKCLWPSLLALSFLHMTVLSFGSMMAAYLMTLSVSAARISVYRGLGELFGITATVVVPPIIARVGSSRAATLFIWVQLTMLVPSVVGAFGKSPLLRGWLSHLAASLLLVCGVGASRLGLWGFDLSVHQLLQTRVVPASALGAVSGVQKSLEAIFGAGAGLAGILLSSPKQFEYLALGSWFLVLSAAVLHTSQQIVPKLEFHNISMGPPLLFGT